MRSQTPNDAPAHFRLPAALKRAAVDAAHDDRVPFAEYLRDLMIADLECRRGAAAMVDGVDVEIDSKDELVTICTEEDGSIRLVLGGFRRVMTESTEVLCAALLTGDYRRRTAKSTRDGLTFDSLATDGGDA